VVDGNVKRVLARLFQIDSPVNQPKHHIIFKQEATRLMGKADPANFNQAIMELGALICRPQKPDCKIRFYQKTKMHRVTWISHRSFRSIKTIRNKASLILLQKF
jgi:adenine-specific DNA glycosylase